LLNQDAVVEATFRLIKAEFVKNRQFELLAQLKLELEKSSI
jgi:hypothetical protein